MNNYVKSKYFAANRNNYYPYSYRVKKVEDLIKSNIEEFKDKKSLVYLKMQDLLKQTESNANESEYFKIVYILQKEDDFTFYMAWNNYNYYSASTHFTKRKYNHYKLVENYIFNRVYEKSKELETKEASDIIDEKPKKTVKLEITVE